MNQEEVKIESIQKISAGYFKLELFNPKIAKQAVPGQFLQIKISGHNEPFLRRPFSIHRVSSQGPAARGKGKNKNSKIIELLCEIKGEGTRILSQKKPGEFLDVIGPLGNGFNSPKPNTQYPIPILVAGGMGVAPIMFLAEKLAIKTRGHQDSRTPVVLIGAETKKQILCEKEFKRLGCEVRIATDDGSKGFKGRVTDLLIYSLRKNLDLGKILRLAKGRPQDDDRDIAQQLRQGLWSIYACGPKPMLRETSRIAQEYRIPAQVSLEEHMSCGFGACLGCVVKTKSGFQRVCKEGPVFDAREIVWDR